MPRYETTAGQTIDDDRIRTIIETLRLIRLFEPAQIIEQLMTERDKLFLEHRIAMNLLKENTALLEARHAKV